MNDEDGVSIAFRDLLMGTLGLCMALIMVLTLWINDPSAKTESQIAAPGQLIVSVFWPEGPTDVDIWLSSPGDSEPVGYSRKSGKVWNLLRDDRGTIDDMLPSNYENAYSRGLPAGDYSANLFCFSCPSVPVTVTILLEKTTKIGTEILRKEKITLEFQGQQKTIWNFKVAEDGTVFGYNQVQKDLIR